MLQPGGTEPAQQKAGALLGRLGAMVPEAHACSLAGAARGVAGRVHQEDATGARLLCAHAEHRQVAIACRVFVAGAVYVCVCERGMCICEPRLLQGVWPSSSMCKKIMRMS